MQSACRLLEDYEGNVHKALIGPPTKEELKMASELETQKNERNLKIYTELCMSLYSICMDGTLHWRHSKSISELICAIIKLVRNPRLTLFLIFS